MWKCGGKKKGGKKYLVLVALLLMSGFAYADQTSTNWFHSHSYTDNVGAPDRYSEYQEKQAMPLGIGIDTVLYEFDGVLNNYGLDSVNTEYKWDIVNNNQSIYGVVHVNAWRVIQKFIK